MSDSPPATAATGRFQTVNGQVLDPGGKVFTARGINISPSQMGAANQVLALFPGLNFVRLTVTDYQSSDTYAAFVNTMTSHGIVVEFEDHTSSDGANGGGERGVVFTGPLLTNELSWYSSVARTFASNPYVWFGTDNEPSATDPISGQRNPAMLSTWQQQTYNAIRGAGNNNPIMLELPGGGYPDGTSIAAYGMDPSVYAKMSNVLVDFHLYGWSSNFSPDQQTVDAAMTAMARGAQTMVSANGTVPVIIGEYGPSTQGETIDANANQVLQAAQHNDQTIGAAAFTWSGSGPDTLTDGQGHLTAYGQEVAQWIASGSQPVASGSPPPSSATVSQSDVSTFATSDTNMSLIGGSSDPMALAAGTDGGDGGKVYVLSAAGNGPLNFTSDVLDNGGILDLRNALAATDWNSAASTLPDYLTVTDTSAGAVVSIASTSGGAQTVIATIPDAIDLNLDALLAHSIT
jgi:hypothetical protein